MTEPEIATETPGVARLAKKLDHALEALASAKDFAKSTYQTDVFQLAEALMGSDAGMLELYERASGYDACGVFVGGPWQDPAELLAPLVAGCLESSGVYPVVETLSDLRVLAIAEGRAQSERLSQPKARAFLNEVMALNLNLLFPGHTEAERTSGGPHREAGIRLLQLIAHRLDLESLHDDVVSEIEQICDQRPIMTGRVRSMISMAERIPETGDGSSSKLTRYSHAISGPTALSQECPDLSDYRLALRGGDERQLEEEAMALATSMETTGLVAPHHAVLLRHLCSRQPLLIVRALALGGSGKAELATHRDFVTGLIKVAIVPSTAQSIYGLGRLLERGLLSRPEVLVGLERLIELDLQTDVRKKLLERRHKHDGATANALLLAGALSMLGQPLGIGQGRNPTCQAARGMSLWAQHAPGYLLELVISAARDGLIDIPFEGQSINTGTLPGEPRPLDPELDPVSLILVPHLDRVYEEMMKRVALRAEDGHKWVNPAMYGRWVCRGFASVFADVGQTLVENHDDFVRRFFATHHPAYNDGHGLMYPNPVGLCVTNRRGAYLGPHAVSLLRIAEDPQGTLRTYFFNPNNEGRQDWGDGIVPSVRDHGEEEGESSLPFREFVSRLYAFHYNPYEEGDAFAVPDEDVAAIGRAARQSWGGAFSWPLPDA